MKLQCVLCGREYEPGAVRYTCPSCGLDGTLDVLYDYNEIRPRLNRTSLASDPDRSLWRYRERCWGDGCWWSTTTRAM